MTLAIPFIDDTVQQCAACVRIDAIIACGRAKGKEEMARFIAFNTLLSVIEADGVLELTPEK